MELFTSGEVDNKKITAEVCVHHMFFNETYYSKLGNQIKCNPSIKMESDRLALIDALKGNKIDLNGYYKTDDHKTKNVMRPSKTLNLIIDNL